MKFFVKIIIMVLITSIVVGISYVIDNDIGIKDIINTDKKAEIDKKYIIQKELELASERADWFEKEIRNVAIDHKDEITLSNCKGLLYDKDGDDIYESKILGIAFKHKKDVVAHYNFCNINYGGDVTVMLSTKKLIEMKEIMDGGEYYIPVYIYKNSLQKGKPLITTDSGLIKLDEFMSF